MIFDYGVAHFSSSSIVFKMTKIQVYHFHNGKDGGVFSVIKNLLKFSTNPLIENHIIYTINKDLVKEYTVKNISGAISEKIFYYSPRWNFYHTCRKLAKLLPDGKAVVVTHDWLELGMVSNLGLQNPVVQFVHGAYSYYYELAKSHASSIDRFIAVAESIETKLVNLLPARRNEIAYLRFPVPTIPYTEKEVTGDLNIIFVGRLEIAKGYPLIPQIAKKLLQTNADVHWHIVGEMNTLAKNEIIWDEKIKVKCYGNISNDAVIEMLKKMQLLILPSLAEGMPVILIEAMKSGVIPLVNNIDGGIRELVINNETGYKVFENHVEEYIEKINELIVNRDKALKMQHNCVALANHLFDPVENTRAIEEIYFDLFSGGRKKKPTQKVYGSRLDRKWVPNWSTKLIRDFTNKL